MSAVNYIKEYPEIEKQLDASYQPFLSSLKKVISLTDALFVHQIDPDDGLYPTTIAEWIGKNAEYKTEPYAVLRIENDLPIEIPYHEYYKETIADIVAALHDAKAQSEKIVDGQFDKTWWQNYFDVLNEGFAQDRWDKVEQHFLSMPPESPLLLTIGPIDTYHDQVFGTKRIFSAWLLVHNETAQAEGTQLWSLLTQQETNLQEVSFFGISPARGNRITHYIGDLLIGGGEVAKAGSMGWSRPENAGVAKQFGSIKAIAYNNFQKHTKKISQDITTYGKKWHISEKITKEVLAFHEEKALLPLLLHEFGHTFFKGENTHANLEQFYTFIEEARANTNMLYIALQLEQQGLLPKQTTRNIFMREFFYLPHLYYQYKVKQQREAYLYSGLLLLFIAKEYEMITITNHKLVLYEGEIEEKLPGLILELKTFLNTLTFFGGDKTALAEHKAYLFAACDVLAEELQLE